MAKEHTILECQACEVLNLITAKECSVCGADVSYLLKKEVSQLSEKQVEHLHLLWENNKLRTQLNDYREALEYYADHYNNSGDDGYYHVASNDDHEDPDDGHIAQDVLDKHKPSEE